MKKCSKCLEVKSEDCFGLRRLKTKNIRQPYCKECSKSYKKKHYKENKHVYKNKVRQRRDGLYLWFQGIKSELVCEKCGEDHIAVLDFHHKDPREKEFEVSALVYKHNASKRGILDEIKKCLVLCKNCHAKLHYDLKK